MERGCALFSPQVAWTAGATTHRANSEMARMATPTFPRPSRVLGELALSPAWPAWRLTKVGIGRPSWCVVLTSGGVDCWGWEFWGQLGNGVDLTLTQSSNVPVAVEGVGGVGTLTGVASLDSQGYNGTTSYCALLKSGGVDCWGIARTGELGGGALNPLTRTVSAVPEAVKGVGGTGTLSGVASLISNLRGYCAVLTSGDMDCWGSDEDGRDGYWGAKWLFRRPTGG